MARAHTKENIARIAELAEHCEDPGIRLRASIALHEIAWGKPQQQVQAEHTLQAGDSLLAVLNRIAANGAGS